MKDKDPEVSGSPQLPNGDGDNRKGPSEKAQVASEMAADIAALRAIVLAAAKHFNVNISPEDEGSAKTSVNFDAVKPKEGCYDEEITVKRQIAQVPTEEMFKSEAWKFLELDPPTTRDLKTVTSGLASMGLASSTTCTCVPIVAWVFNGRFSPDFGQYGYTADGYISDTVCYIGLTDGTFLESVVITDLLPEAKSEQS
jgi:hypothetical protein